MDSMKELMTSIEANLLENRKSKDIIPIDSRNPTNNIYNKGRPQS